MKKRFLAILLVLTMVLAVLPVQALAASGKVRGISAGVSVTDDGVVMNLKWKKVSGAEGYEYAYNLFWKKGSGIGNYTVKSTDKTSAKIALKDYGAVDVRVRAYRTVNGKKVYGAWSNSRLKRSKLDKLVIKQLKKRMKSKKLFLKATSGTVNVYAGAGDGYRVVSTMNRLDEARATGSFKRDGSGTWWSKIYVSLDQNHTTTGWVSRKVTDPVWY